MEESQGSRKAGPKNALKEKGANTRNMNIYQGNISQSDFSTRAV